MGSTKDPYRDTLNSWIGELLPKADESRYGGSVDPWSCRKERPRPSKVRGLGIKVQTSLKSQILNARNEALKEENIEAEKLYNAEQKFEVWSNRVKYLIGRAWIPKIDNLWEVIMDEAHRDESKDNNNQGKTEEGHEPTKSYADNHKKPLEIRIGYKIFERVGLVAYRIELPKELSGIHDVFHVLNFKKCLTDETLLVPLVEIRITDKLQFIEEPLEIMDHKVKRLKHSRIPIVKVRWNSLRGPGFTWKRKDQMKRKYPHLFMSTPSVE
ncbi:hypothetical protein Tco_0923298 [Tanacetum coccineum]|uniref:Tf2-1-like SH3-like domain-containing protein n=1 Tax=Tanacetum coccineum TaxID=301880 RepID=A0ABQ5D715_9ASTR